MEALAVKLYFFFGEISVTVKDSLYNMKAHGQDKKPDSQAKKALIVDDESDICFLLSNILKQANIQPVMAGSITEAEKVLESPQAFRYVFLDNYLPDGLGINQIKKWKERFPSIHLIMITAHDSHEERKKAKVDGVDHFIPKPFSKDIILNTIVATPD